MTNPPCTLALAPSRPTPPPCSASNARTQLHSNVQPCAQSHLCTTPAFRFILSISAALSFTVCSVVCDSPCNRHQAIGPARWLQPPPPRLLFSLRSLPRANRHFHFVQNPSAQTMLCFLRILSSHLQSLASQSPPPPTQRHRQHARLHQVLRCRNALTQAQL